MLMLICSLSYSGDHFPKNSFGISMCILIRVNWHDLLPMSRWHDLMMYTTTYMIWFRRLCQNDKRLGINAQPPSCVKLSLNCVNNSTHSCTVLFKKCSPIKDDYGFEQCITQIYWGRSLGLCTRNVLWYMLFQRENEAPCDELDWSWAPVVCLMLFMTPFLQFIFLSRKSILLSLFIYVLGYYVLFHVGNISAMRTFGHMTWWWRD